MYRFTVPIGAATHFDKEKLLPILKECKTSRILLFLFRETDHRFSSPKNLEKLREYIDFFRKNGLKPAVWIGETLGHDQAPISSQEGNTPYRHLKLPHEGTVASFCPTDEALRKDLCAWIGAVAEMGPEMIVIDDDFCLYGGCVCEEHTKRILAELGEDLSPEELYARAFSGGENPYRHAWRKIQGESLYQLAREMRATVDKIDPNIRLGLCIESHHWDACGISVAKLIRILAGNTTPFLRTAGAPYHFTIDHATSLGAAVELERCQAHWCKDFGTELISEGDTYPRPRFSCPAAYLECFDQILQADGSFDGILKYALDYFSDEDYEKGYMDAWRQNLPLYEKIHTTFQNKISVGITPYRLPNTAEEADMEERRNKKVRLSRFCGGFYNAATELAVQNNLPIAYEGEGALILFGEVARAVPLEELKRGCILDLSAAKILQQRGIDVGILSATPSEIPPNLWMPAEEYFMEEDRYVRVSGGAIPMQVQYAEKAQILTEFIIQNRRFHGWARYENQEGLRFLLLPFDAPTLMGDHQHKGGHLNGYSLRRMLIKQTEWLNKTPLEAYAEGDHPQLYTLVKKGSCGLAIGLWNLFDDKIRNLTVKINGSYNHIRFINCEGVPEGDTVRLTTVLYPYEFAGIEFKL